MMQGIVCPLCRLPLDRRPGSWRCPWGHSFDVAREGYVNLLPVQQKHSREPGDSTEMVVARREFLQAGHYQRLGDAAVQFLAPLQAQSLLDTGCGEGYYTCAFTSIAAEVTGLDISKAAVRLAAKRFPGITWLVGSGSALPLADATTDVVSSLFCPLHISEMHRVLRPGGHVLVVTPAPEHLLSLREVLFEEVRAHAPDKFVPGFEAGFELRATEAVRFPLTLTQTALRQLLLMTPYAWRAKPERRAALNVLESVVTEAAFSMMLFGKR